MSSIDDQIEQAIREGKFDNLAGHGQPLHWDDNPHEDPEWALAHHIIKSSGYNLPWIENRQHIIAELVKARQALARTWAWRANALVQGQPAPRVAAEWERAVATFKTQIAAINKRLLTYNLEIPDPRFELPLCNAEQEISKLIQAS
jgi:DnaJ family protein C protein 28